MNVLEKLGREIRRVAAKQARYQETKRVLGASGAGFTSAIALMEHSLEEALLALGSGDLARKIRALNDLSEFSDE